MPPLEIDTTVPYAECREAFAGLDDADLAIAIVEHPVYLQIMGPALDELQITSKGKRGPQKFYGFAELEKLLVYQRLAGFRDYAAERMFLAGDLGGPHRRKLGFDHSRDRTRGRRSEARDGMPCDRTIRRYLRVWPEGMRVQLIDRVWQTIRDEWLTTPAAAEECRRLTIDGTVYRTHYTCPPGFKPDGSPKQRLRKHRITGETVDTVTCPTGGYMGMSSGADHSGDGWNAMPLVTGRGRTLNYCLVPNGTSEKLTARQVMRDYDQTVRPILNPDGIVVLSADGGFESPELRRELREMGIMANIPRVSGSGSESAKRNRTAKAAQRLAIEGKPGWYADGFRELICEHGKVPTINRSFLHPDGHVVERIEGQCRQGCGTTTITNGDYRVAQNPPRLVRRRASDPSHDKDDELFGSPLTQNSKLANAFGGKRFGKHEGFNSALHTRFGLLNGKSWIRHDDPAHQNFALTVMAQWILSDIAEATQSTSAPPPLTPAAAPVLATAPAELQPA